jgi:integrase
MDSGARGAAAETVEQYRFQLRRYITPRATAAGPPGRWDALVFTGAKGGPLRRSTFNGLVRRKEATAAVGAPGPHLVRLAPHRQPPGVASAGTTVKDLMERMGHDNERAAMIYLHRSQGADRRIADAMPVELGDMGSE